MNFFLILFSMFFFLMSQQKTLNKKKTIDIGEVDFFMQRDSYFLQTIKKELKNKSRSSFDLDFNYDQLMESSTKKEEEFIDNQFSFLMSYPYYYQIFFNVERLIKENFYSFFVQTKNLEKTESSQKEKKFIINGGYNTFNMGSSLEFNHGETKIDFLFSSTEEGSQNNPLILIKFFQKKYKDIFLIKILLLKIYL